MDNNVVCKFTLLKRVFWFEYQCLEPMYACGSDFFTPNEEHLNSAINNYNILKIIAAATMTVFIYII